MVRPQRDTATNSTMTYPKNNNFEKARIRALFRREHFWIFQQLNLLQCLGAYFPPPTADATTTDATDATRRDDGDD